MGKYTSLARAFRDEEPPASGEEKKSIQRNKYVNINRIEYIEGSNSQAPSVDKDTTLRPTTLTTLIKGEKDETRTITCVHGLTEEMCAVCSGFVHWLIEDENRMRLLFQDPEQARRTYWRNLGTT